MNGAPGLRAQQQWLEGAIVGQGLSAAEVDSRLTRGPRMTAEERLEIYRHGYSARLVECLADDYPALKDLLGEEDFESTARTYVERYPSHSPSLNRYGCRMADLLSPRGGPLDAFASDLARLEWALVEAIHAPPAPELTPERLAAVGADGSTDLRLVAAPSARLLRFGHPVNRYYQAFHAVSRRSPPPRWSIARAGWCGAGN
jgi:hypothetical protein